MAGIKIDPEMLDIYMESLNKLMAVSYTHLTLPTT